MKSRGKVGLLLVGVALLLTAAPAATATTIESINARAAVSGTSIVTFTDDLSRSMFRCTHNIVIPTAAFTGTGSVSIEAANNVYLSCRYSDGRVCTIRPNGRWTFTAATVTSGTLRLDASIFIECVSLPVYSCVYAIAAGQSLNVTFTNPVAPSRTGALLVDRLNSLSWTLQPGSRNCPLGSIGRGSFTIGETLSTENLRIR